MNQIAKTGAAALPAGPRRLPAFAAGLERPQSYDMALRRPDPEPAYTEQAHDALREYGDEHPAAPADTVRRWCVPVANAVRNPPAPEDFGPRVHVIAVACAELPGWVFNAQSQAEAVRKFQFWPSAADVVELLTDHARPHFEKLGELRRLAKLWPPVYAPTERPQTAEEREAARQHVANTLAALKAELAADEAREKPSAPARMAPQLSRETLNAIYARDGITGPSVPVRKEAGQ